MGLSQDVIELISGVPPFLGSLYYNSYSENLIEEYIVDYAYRYEIVGGMINFPISTIWDHSHNISVNNTEIQNKNICTIKNNNLYNKPGVLLFW